ncbi:hypothetical protein GGG16DRAFT_117904 [Schizophyllum commune]
MFDTYHAARALGLPSLSLAHLLKTYCAYEPDKRLARADWRIRPLPPTHLSYARSDTHFLPFVYDRLKGELAGVAPPTLPADPHGDGEAVDIPIDVSLTNGEGAPDTALTAVLQASARVCLRTPRWLTSATLPAAAMATARRAGRENLLDEGSLDHAIYLALYKWRDATARAADEGVGTILPNSSLLLIADKWWNLIFDNAHQDPTPTPLALAAPHAALASLVAPAALPAPVRLRAGGVVGVVLGAVRGWQGKAGSKGIEKAGSKGIEKAGAVEQQKVEKGEMEMAETTKEQQEEEGKVVETANAVKTTPTPTSALFGRKPSTAASTSSTSVAASSSSLFGGALGPRAASSSLLGGSAPSATAPAASATSTAHPPAASRSALFGGTLRTSAASSLLPSTTAKTVTTESSATKATLASIAARVHASFGVIHASSGVIPTTPSSANPQSFEPSAAALAEHAFVPAGQRSTASTTVFSSVKKSMGLTDEERKALADAQDDAMHEDSSSSEDVDSSVAAIGSRQSGSKKSDKDDKKSKKDKKSKETSKAAPSVAADAIVAGAGARQKKRKRTKGPALDLSGDTAGVASSSTSRANTQGAPNTAPAVDTPFDYASVPNILDAPGPSSTPTTERPRKKKRRVEEKGPHFRAPAPAPAEVRGVKVNLAHTFGK